MINILLPAMGKSEFFKDFYFPKQLAEINGKTMLEMVIDDYKTFDKKNFIFIFNNEDCRKFHLDSSVQILAPDSHVIKLHKETAGALCTCLMAVDYINNDVPLIISNSDQIIDLDYKVVIEYFGKNHADAGVITFPSIHPRWSYARVHESEVVEVAEKRPLSRNAIAGFYYYKHGSDFIEAAKKTLLKQNNLDGRYYISASMNELILIGKKIGFYGISKEQYKSFYSPAKIKEYEVANESRKA